MPKIVILNGPPRCGKDTAAIAVTKSLKDCGCVHMKISQPLKDIARGVFGLSNKQLEATKFSVLSGHPCSYVDAQIQIYQHLSKIFGASWLGKALVHKINATEFPYIVLSDGGRPADITPLLLEYGPKNLMIIQIMREGCSFSGDIRSYISASADVQIKPIINDNKEAYEKRVQQICEEFFSE